MIKENRYAVLKHKDIWKYLNNVEQIELSKMCGKILAGRAADSKAPLSCVVVESDWPEYEPVWKMIADRVDA